MQTGHCNKCTTYDLWVCAMICNSLLLCTSEWLQLCSCLSCLPECNDLRGEVWHILFPQASAKHVPCVIEGGMREYMDFITMALLPTLARQISNQQLQKQAQYFFDDLLSSIWFITNKWACNILNGNNYFIWKAKQQQNKSGTKYISNHLWA